MSTQWFGYLGALIVLTLSLVNLLAQDWRKRVIALAIQAIGVFFLCWQSLSWTLAFVKFIEGWMAAAILGSAMSNLNQNRKTSQTSLQVSPTISFPLSAFAFRLATVLLVGVFTFGGASSLMANFNGVRFPQAIAILGLSGISLLILGFRTSTFSISLGLITFLNGFEILLAVIEPSVMLTGLLAGVVLSISFLGAYLLTIEGVKT
ncbi:MAG: hypothetical protein N3D16_06935 [Anaerolineales bacterium]|nr:hypothetical protein [Anaerolineales bacterium]